MNLVILKGNYKILPNIWKICFDMKNFVYVVPDPEFRPIPNRAPDLERNHCGRPIWNLHANPNYTLTQIKV